MTAEKREQNWRMTISYLNLIQVVAFSLLILLVSGCGSSNSTAQKLSLSIGFDENWHVKTYWDDSEWNGMSKWATWSRTNENEPFNISFLAAKDSSRVTIGNDAASTKRALPPTNAWNVLTQTISNNAAIWIRGTLQPLDTNWDYFSCSVKVSSKMPMELTFFGFQNTNNIQTNEDGTFFNLNAGETNISFVGKVVSVFEKQKSRPHK
jgi:hypothetical protein